MLKKIFSTLLLIPALALGQYSGPIYNPANVNITGGAINGVTVGATTPSTIRGTAIVGNTFNGNTWTTGTGTLTLGVGKTINLANSLTFTGTDASSIAFGTGGTVLYNGGNLGTPSAGVATNLTGTAAGLTAGTVTTNANLTGAVTSVGNATSLGSFTSANLAGALTNETGSGAAVFAISPSLTTPDIGVATATSVNKVAITAPATNATLTIANGKTLTAAKTFTVDGTDGAAISVTAGGIGITTPTSGQSIVLANGVTLTIDNILRFSGSDFAQLNIGSGGTLGRGAYDNSYVLGTSGAAVSHTGTTAITTLATINLPANTLGANGSVEIEMQFSITPNTANAKNIYVYLDTTVMGSFSATGATDRAFFGKVTIRNQGATNAQVGTLVNAGATSYGISTTTIRKATKDTTTSLDIFIKGELLNSSDILVLEGYTIKVVKP